MFATLSSSQMAALRGLRHFDAAEVASTIRASLFAGIKTQFGIPQEHKVKVEVDNVAHPAYGVIVRKKTGMAYSVNEGTGKIQDTTYTPAPVETRWFSIDLDDTTSRLIDRTNSFEDEGWLSSDMAEDTPEFVVDGYTLRVDDETLFVKLGADKF